MKNQARRTTRLSTNPTRRFRITHPFHPLFSRECELVEFRRDWARERALFYDEQGHLVAVPVDWTDLADQEDPFVTLSEGRAHFRVVDLVALVELIEEARS
jgi:hypothetical protein